MEEKSSQSGSVCRNVEVLEGDGVDEEVDGDGERGPLEDGLSVGHDPLDGVDWLIVGNKLAQPGPIVEDCHLEPEVAIICFVT